MRHQFHQDLAVFQGTNYQVTLVQFVDDLLNAAETEEACPTRTKRHLEELGDLGYHASIKRHKSASSR